VEEVLMMKSPTPGGKIGSPGGSGGGGAGGM
jgi:hypothetical protein